MRVARSDKNEFVPGFLMRVFHKILLHIIAVASFLVLLYAYLTSDSGENRIFAVSENFTSPAFRTVVDKHEPVKTREGGSHGHAAAVDEPPVVVKKNVDDSFNVWCIFTKVSSNAPLKYKFKRFTHSLVQHASIRTSLHIITDNSSRTIAEEIFENVRVSTSKDFLIHYYDVKLLAEQLEDIISAMQPHFSSQPGTYYSDALFFLSLGLHRIAINQERAIMFDADTKLLTDVAHLFKEFDNFGPDALFGLAPELTPVYHHVLYMYRSRHKKTMFGEPASSPGGFPGVNSGVVLFRLDRMRQSKEYNELLKLESVSQLTSKYSFKGHLGDQDFYTLLAMEKPNLVHLLSCLWNRQLCTWWRDHGYRDVFDKFFHCEGSVNVYHGNCNTPIPDD
ncbi:xyloside xylosyltransferase 1 [Anabrus simplex]|uniref:xyloside xylosyltransferase 1 n=1 Tax=Anabrus simplex TaxID=316456 RepID=UPI0035A30C48